MVLDGALDLAIQNNRAYNYCSGMCGPNRPSLALTARIRLGVANRYERLTGVGRVNPQHVKCDDMTRTFSFHVSSWLAR